MDALIPFVKELSTAAHRDSENASSALRRALALLKKEQRKPSRCSPLSVGLPMSALAQVKRIPQRVFRTQVLIGLWRSLLGFRAHFNL